MTIGDIEEYNALKGTASFALIGMNRLRRANKLFAVFTSILMLAQSFFPIFPLITPQVFAQDVTPTETQTVSEPAAEQSNTQTTETAQAQEASPTETPAPTETQTPSPTPADVTPTPTEGSQPSETGPPSDNQGEIGADGATTTTPSNQDDITTTPTAEPSATLKVPTELVYATEGQSFNDATEEYWNIDLEKGSAETKGKVQLGIKYVFPLEHKVTVTFTALPKDESIRANLKIQKVKISDLNLPDDVKPYGEFAYDITTGMTDGDFEYTLTLPKAEDSTATVNYIEKSVEEATKGTVASGDIKKVSTEHVDQNTDGNSVQVTLDHFTILFTSSETDTGNPTVTIDKPTGTTSGDLLIAGITFNGGSNMTITAPSGWTLILRTNNGTNVGIATYHKIAGASEPSDYSWTINNGSSSSTERGAGGIARYTGVYATSPIDVSAGASGSGDNSAEAPSVTTNFANDVVVAFYGVGDNLSFGQPSGTTERYDVTHSDSNGPGTSAADFTQAVAGATGTKQSDISGNSDEVWVAQQVAIRMAPETPPVTNPPLGQSCGIDIGLAVDTSLSIDNTELNTMKTALKGFVNAFVGTPTQMSVVSFNTNATVESGFTSDLASLSNASGVIDDISGSSGYTNWEDALQDLHGLFPNRADKPDLIVFTTDGDPTESSAGGPTTTQPNNHLAPAITQANLAKADGIRIITLGIGLSGAASQTRLEQISSADAVYNADNFDDLANTLNDLVSDLCGGTITVNKYIGSVSEANRAETGWTFNVAGTTRATDANGQTQPVEVTPGTYSVTETGLVDGYTFASASCQTQTGSPVGTAATNGVSGISVGASDIISCNFINNEPVETIQICHATASHTNPYIINTPAKNGDVSGHAADDGPIWYPGITVEWGDIIPPFTYSGGSFPGLNWDAYGQLFYQSGCNKPATDISVTKSDSPDPVNNGGVLTYTLTIENESVVPAEDVVVNDTLPAGFAVTSVTPSVGSCSDQTAPSIQCELGNLAANGSATITIVGTITTALTTVTNSVSVTTDSPETITNNNTDTEDTTVLHFGSVKVNKLLDSDGNGSFETTNPAAFTWSLDGSGTNAMGTTVNNVTLGAHNVNENTVTNYHPVGWFPGGTNSTQYSCTNLPQGNTTLPAAITVTADQTTEITICNALDTGTITVRKMVDRDGNGTYDETNPADFTWTLDGVGPYAMGFSNTAVPVGSHNINENSPSNYHFVGWFPTGQQGWSCTNLPTNTQNTNFHQLPIPVNVGSGGTSDYTICNARNTGSVTIVKEVVGGTALPADWDFTISSVAGTFKSGNSVTLPTGSYTVTESGPADYSATAVTGICSGLQGSTATMTVTENGGTCTFTNTRDTGSLKVNKRTDGNGDGDYQDSGEGVNESDSNGFTWSIDGSGTNAIGSTVAGVTTGNHDIGENTVAGYHFVGWFTTSKTQYSCTNPEGTTLPVSVAVAKNKIAEITLCNARDTGSITIIKNAVPNSDQNFSFDVSSGFPGGDFELEDDGNDNNGGTEESKTVSVATGQYWVEEDGETGWQLTSLVCNDQNGTVNIVSGRATLNVEAGEAITCTFTNEKLGTLIIKKDATPNSDENFRFTRSFGSSFELEDDGNDNNGGTDETRTFENLAPGSYTVTEDSKTGWTLSNIVCSDQTVPNVQGRSVTVEVGYNETVTCTFRNTELGKIRGYKFNDTNGDGNRDTGEEYLNGWSIFIDANTNGQYDDGELTQTTSGQFWFFGWQDEGEYEFANLLPGTYSVCEVPQDDWTNSTPLCQSTELRAGDTDEVYFGNHGPLTLRAYKIVCENESDLPNWGDNDAPNINATTAQNFVDNSEGACRFEEGWDFQWGYDGEVVKYGNGDQLGAAPSPWQTLGTTNASGYTEAAITSIDEDDDLWVREVLRANYVPFSYPPAAPTENAYSAEIYCHRDGQNYDNFDRVDDVRFGQTYYCVAFNALNTGDIIVTKYNDDNGNGTQDEGEETLPGWDMTVQSVGDDIYNTTQTTGQDGTTTFEDVTVGDYVLTETLKEGWRQTELSCGDIRQDARLADDTADDSADDVEEETNGRFTLNGGQTVRCTVGNQFINPDLTITKSNDTAGGDRSPGGNVTFTLTVSAADSEVLDVIVKDLPAGGFTYRPGSWTAVSNVRGDLKALLVTTEPTYASPGTWNLGDMQEGEIVTLTYIADISNDEQPGLYRDLAWAQGKDLLANKVVANDTDSPQYFVGTEVNVVKNDQSGASVNVKQEVLGAVLGASTELPATGANSIWFIIAAIFMSLGSVTALAGWVLRRKYA